VLHNLNCDWQSPNLLGPSLGVSINVLPFTMYEMLGLGELKTTRMALELANHSTKLPRGMVKDVLIKVGEFIFSVDFVVLERRL